MNILENAIGFLGETMDSIEVIDFELKNRPFSILNILCSLYMFSY